MKKHFLLCWLVCSSFPLLAQVGGESSMDFLLLEKDARVSAIGGENVSTAGHDVNMIFYNPAALSDTMVNRVAFNYRPFYADINKTSLAGALNTKFGPIGLTIQNMGYGDFTLTDPSANVLGEFRANEFAIGITKSHEVGPFSIGGTLRWAHSRIWTLNAGALLLDIGGMYHHPKHDLQIGLVTKNIGVPMYRYYEEGDVELPFDLQAGVSYKLAHMPLRFSTTLHKLYRYDIQYLDPTRNITLGEDGEEVIPEKSTSEKIARHFVFGGEFIFSRNLHFRVGYNHLRRKELQSTIRRGGSGFSWGFMIRISAFEFNFTRTYMHAAGGTTALTIATDINKFRSGKKVKTKSKDKQLESKSNL